MSNQDAVTHTNGLLKKRLGVRPFQNLFNENWSWYIDDYWDLFVAPNTNKGSTFRKLGHFVSARTCQNLILVIEIRTVKNLESHIALAFNMFIVSKFNQTCKLANIPKLDARVTASKFQRHCSFIYQKLIFHMTLICLYNVMITFQIFDIFIVTFKFLSNVKLPVHDAFVMC